MSQFFIIFSAFFFYYMLASNASKHKTKQNIYRTPENIRNEGYQAETHRVTTVDGYILEMHRIPYPRHDITGDSARPVVLLMHGITTASNAFIFLGSKNSIGYNLADAGFDVWMGNARGTKNSRRHVALNPDHKEQVMEFFDFTWEEIGLYDNSAMIDYILNHTGHRNLHYIGHSQGGTAFLVLTSMRPEYNKKIASAHLLAGIGYQNHFPEETIKTFASFTDFIFSIARNLRVIELFPLKTTDVISTSSFYSTLSGYFDASPICESEYFKFLGLCNLLHIEKSSHAASLRPEDALIINTGDEDDIKGGGSLKQVAHYGQNIRDSSFRRWNYGRQIANTEIYGTPDPPLYNIKLITTNVTMHYTVGDDLLDEKDVLSMVGVMPNAVARKVARESFLHEDFISAPDMKELVTDHIIQAIKYIKEKPLTESICSSTPTTSYSFSKSAFHKVIPSSAASSALDVITKLYLLFISLRFFRLL